MGLRPYSLRGDILKSRHVAGSCAGLSTIVITVNISYLKNVWLVLVSVLKLKPRKQEDKKENKSAPHPRPPSELKVRIRLCNKCKQKTIKKS